ncbi:MULTISPECIES: mobile element protein [Streptomyces]|uniref:Mobile element protein n=1 Tax=Streptomyces europaeiscabiei TaxID=146819 RepID=A0ABU4NQT4_9ACTN|nr:MULTISPECIES: mobile element protein [Streptomyces]MBP5922178.1 mobile element protein [Streptomyces sp. LBUM 1483]MDX3555189.1 mobile element protein [Streptomyces europaeiscabiei]MDX3705203.1 mobile element protein [Streptomyces europaeiscabiei]MDX3864386.1 mobile element protein [Streptomyces europaeiscabiei]MDX3871532.1 mobile element protein [Streptomyces europaeiscabiei]
MADEYLADPAELAEKLGRDEDDPKLLYALRAASRRFRGQVGHAVIPVTTETVTLDGTGRESLLLPVWPTTAVQSVELEGVELVEGTDYDWSDAGILRRLGCRVWPDKLRCLEVGYSHGFATSPEDIQEVVLERAEAAFTIPVGVQSKAVGGQSVTFGAQAASGSTEAWTKCVARHAVRTVADV